MLAMALRAARLETGLYKETEGNPAVILPALGIVTFAALSFGLSLVYAKENTSVLGSGTLTQALLLAMSSVIVGWLLWAFIASAISRICGGHAGFRSTLRNIGLAYGPGILVLLSVIPVAGDYLIIGSWVWLLLSVGVAIRETQGISLWKSTIPSLLGWYMAVIRLPGFLLSLFLMPIAD